MDEILWALQARQIHTEHTTEEEFVLRLAPQEITGWQDLLRRFALAMGQRIEMATRPITDSEGALFTVRPPQDPKVRKALAQAISKGEYVAYPPLSDLKYDLKVGYSCNNNCVHCVIKPNLWAIQKERPEAVVMTSGQGMICREDLNPAGLLDLLAKQPRDLRWITLTGGEPTVREDFIPIVRWIYYNRPHTNITLQTNGRALADENLVRAMRRYTRQPQFTVAMHGLEATHNRVVSNRKDAGNPFQETTQALRLLKRYFVTTNPSVIRVEVVLSTLNVHEMLPLVRYLYEDLGLTWIGFSFPHLYGFPQKAAEKLTPNLAEIFPEMQKLHEYAQAHEDLVILLEEVPICQFVALPLPWRFVRFRDAILTNTIINYLGQSQVDASTEEYRDFWLEAHDYPPRCVECALKGSVCAGIWREVAHLNDAAVKPIPEITPAAKAFIRGHIL